MPPELNSIQRNGSGERERRFIRSTTQATIADSTTQAR